MTFDHSLSRKDFVVSAVLGLAGASLPASASGLLRQEPEIGLDDLKAVEKIAGISFTDAERKEVLSAVRDARGGYESIRALPIEYRTEPATVFTPLGGGSLPDSKMTARPAASPVSAKGMNPEDMAFLSVRDLSHLVRTRQVSPVELTELYLARLKQYGDKLLCVVTLTEDLARAQARQAEKEISEGHYRGPLHGIPFGAKDLFAVRGYPTTWGANTFEHQSFDYDATVIDKLFEAGAILVAKLSMGALALGDVWFRGTTKNPWNPSEGSSGSSAGSAAATAAGLVGFAIGTETYGSITSPSHRCRVTGLRPTYGRVSRYGAMALAYTMDKVGPICREAEDCALVLAAMAGSDPNDPSAVDRPFSWEPRLDFRKLKIGFFVSSENDLHNPAKMNADPAVGMLQSLGATVTPVRIRPMPNGMDPILTVESGSAFDAFTRTGEVRNLTNSPWPESFRRARYVPAVEYLQAQRARHLFMQAFENDLGDLDAVMAPGIGGQLLETNYTGHPQLLIPFGTSETGASSSRSLIGRLYHEDRLLAIGKALQHKAGFFHRRPNLAKLG